MSLIGDPLGIVLYDAFITPGIGAKMGVTEPAQQAAAPNAGQAAIPVTGKKE